MKKKPIIFKFARANSFRRLFGITIYYNVRALLHTRLKERRRWGSPRSYCKVITGNSGRAAELLNPDTLSFAVNSFYCE